MSVDLEAVKSPLEEDIKKDIVKVENPDPYFNYENPIVPIKKESKEESDTEDSEVIKDPLAEETVKYEDQEGTLTLPKKEELTEREDEIFVDFEAETRPSKEEIKVEIVKLENPG